MSGKGDIPPGHHTEIPGADMKTMVHSEALEDTVRSGAMGPVRRTARRARRIVHLRAAANYIRSGHYSEALNVLNGIKERGALWYFYSASANSGLGNNVTALEHAKEAVRLDPENMQYQMLLRDFRTAVPGISRDRACTAIPYPLTAAAV